MNYWTKSLLLAFIIYLFIIKIINYVKIIIISCQTIINNKLIVIVLNICYHKSFNIETHNFHISIYFEKDLAAIKFKDRV